MTKCRPFSLADGMILIAATAVGLGILRVFPDVGPMNSLSMFLDAFFMTYPSVLAATFSFLIIRFRRPRPALPRLMRQPGLFACITVALLVATVLPLLLIFASKAYSNIRGGLAEVVLESFVELFPPVVGFTVLIGWELLAICGPWRPESGWIDAMGTVLGLYWVVLSVLWVYLGVG